MLTGKRGHIQLNSLVIPAYEPGSRETSADIEYVKYTVSISNESAIRFSGWRIKYAMTAFKELGL
ncbi:hypothetical protein KIH87_05800 [Paraneptunicella aestuarii]|uniref:hypothetical protein n=1 Tax=Paraneptunicella aestuarii TaxID=2831148 RepID=UPI001E569D0F|nr:hypothetical protein [Paraneptunicella aestuarii]UAA39867.1 hypothetical protein KIH87_05800 [Paraneptunicella aestuarii]